jgi:hypothetical protein
MLNKLLKAQVFTKLDLRNTYYRLWIKEGNKWKTAFKTQYRHFKYLVIPFRLANALVTF